MLKLKALLLTQGMHGMVSQTEGLAKALWHFAHICFACVFGILISPIVCFLEAWDV